MTFNEIATRVAKRSNKSINNTEVSTRIKEEINYAGRIAWNNFPWTFRNREFLFTTVPQVTIGTVEVTADSRTITFSSAVLSDTFKGAWIRFPGAEPDNWYKIKTVSSSTVALVDPAYVGTTDAAATYELRKQDYLVPMEIRDFSSLNVTGSLGPISIDNFNTPAPLPIFPLGSATRGALFNQSIDETTYSDGTVSAALNTRVITGVGTAFLSNVTEGDSFIADSNTYTVASIESDTQLTLYNHVKTALSGSAYQTVRKFGKVLRLPTSTEDKHTVVIKALRKYSPLVNDLDFNELTEDYPDELEEMALRLELSSTPDNRENAVLQVASLLFQRAQGTDQGMFPKHNSSPIFNVRSGRSTRFGGRRR